LELRPLVAAIGIELPQKWMQAERRRHHQHAAIPVLDVGRRDDGLQQQTLRIYQDGRGGGALFPVPAHQTGRADSRIRTRFSRARTSSQAPLLPGTSSSPTLALTRCTLFLDGLAPGATHEIWFRFGVEMTG